MPVDFNIAYLYTHLEGFWIQDFLKENFILSSNKWAFFYILLYLVQF